MAVSEGEVVDWLLGGDVAVAFQTARDLLGQDRPELQARIATEGHGAALLAARGANGHWGRGFYQPKWTSSHYTLLELKNLGLPPGTEPARETVQLILRREKSRDGGLNPTATVAWSDACVNGMALGYSAYFGAEQDAADQRRGLPARPAGSRRRVQLPVEQEAPGNHPLLGAHHAVRHGGDHRVRAAGLPVPGR